MPRHLPGALRVLAALAAGTLVVSLSACASGDTDAPAPAASTTSVAVYRLSVADPGTEIDPLTVVNGQIFTGLVTEPLISSDATGALHPRLATAWTASDDGLTWTITVRPGAKFNDGSPVTAKDVAATFQAITAPDSVSPGRSSFSGVLASVEADGDATVVFTLERPFSDFPLLLTGSNTAILPADYEPGTWLQNPVGAGQFLLTDYTVGKGATYVKNPDYWDAENIRIDGVQLKIFGDTQASVLAFQAGELDRINISNDVEATVDVSKYDVISTGYNMFFAVTLNVTQAPFDDPTVREALAWAIDRDGIVADVHSGDADPGNDTTFFPDYDPQPDVAAKHQDLDRVAKLLAGRTVAFTITTSNQLYGEVLQQQLNAVPGFTVDLNVLSAEQYYADGEATPWLNAGLTITNWGKRAPSQYLSLLYAGGAAWNASHYANPTLDALTAQFDATTDPDERQQLARQIGEIQSTDLPVLVPAFARSQALQNPRVTGTFAGALDFYTGYSFAGISIDE